MTIIEHGAGPAAPAADVDSLDEFDLDVRIAVGEDLTLPEAGFTCSWYTCGGGTGGCASDTTSLTSWHACC